MSSILTNASAMTALKTLQQTNKGLETTQGRISTGLRVAQASDNAAYWSIATTMRSDNKAMSTVKDALGLGAAQVDVAYTAMDSVKNTLDKIKSKLVAASQPNVDKDKIQEEVKQLQNDLKTFAESASFSGGNWLSVDKTSSQKIVASFIRDSSGGISLGTIDVDTAKTALFTADGNGLLQQASGNTSTGAVGQAQATAGAAQIDATDAVRTTAEFKYDPATVADGDTLTFSFDFDGAGAPVDVDHVVADASSLKLEDIVATLNGDAGFSAMATASEVDGKLVVTHKGAASTGTNTGTDSKVELLSVASDNVATNVKAALGFDKAVQVSGTDQVDATAGKATLGAFSEMEFDDNDTLTFNLNIDGKDHAVTIDKATIDAAGTATAGVIADATEFEAVMTRALENANVNPGTDVTLATVNGQLEITSNTTGANSNVSISATRASSGSAAFDIMDMDISDATADELSGFVQGVDEMLTSVTTAASDLGAIKSRISSQQEFVTDLMNAVDRGVGALVDANMNEESTRLQALQVQQQLGIQALSIANGSAQSILSLFR